MMVPRKKLNVPIRRASNTIEDLHLEAALQRSFLLLSFSGLPKEAGQTFLLARPGCQD